MMPPPRIAMCSGGMVGETMACVWVEGRSKQKQKVKKKKKKAAKNGLVGG